MSKPIRHVASTRNRKKALKFADDIIDELEHMDYTMRELLDEHMRYLLGRARRLHNRLVAEVERDNVEHPGESQ